MVAPERLTAADLVRALDQAKISPLGMVVALLIWSGDVEASVPALGSVLSTRNRGSIRRLLSQLEDAGFLNVLQRAALRGRPVSTTTHFTTTGGEKARVQMNLAAVRSASEEGAEKAGSVPMSEEAAAHTDVKTAYTGARRDAPPGAVLATAARFAGRLEGVSSQAMIAAVWQIWRKYPWRRPHLSEIVAAAVAQTEAKAKAGEIQRSVLAYFCGTLLEMARLGTWRHVPASCSTPDNSSSSTANTDCTPTGPVKTRVSSASRGQSMRSCPSVDPNRTVDGFDVNDPYVEAQLELRYFAAFEWEMLLSKDWDDRAYWAVRDLCERYPNRIEPDLFRAALDIKRKSPASAFYWARRLATAADLEKTLLDLLNETVWDFRLRANG